MNTFRRNISLQLKEKIEKALVDAVLKGGLEFFESEWTQTAFYLRVGANQKRVGVTHLLVADAKLSDLDLAKKAKSNIESWIEGNEAWLEHSFIGRVAA